LHVVARARDRHHVYELWAAGCRDIIRETYDSALRAGRSSLEALGIRRPDAERLMAEYEVLDREGMVELANLYRLDLPAHLNPPYIEKVREITAKSNARLRGTAADMGSDAAD
jgi:CPA2 family monovalent cation:H+ antiporter-2